MALAAGLLLIASGCGDDGPTVASAAPFDSNAAITAGDAICKQLASDVDELVADFRSTHPKPSADDAREFLVNTLIVRMEHGVGDLHRLRGPQQTLAADYTTVIDALDKDLAAFKQSVGADPLKVIAAPIKLYGESAAKFAALGFKECGKT